MDYFPFRENERQRQCKLFQEIVTSRKATLLNTSENDNEESFTSDSRNIGVSEFEHKVAKRYFNELNIIRREAGEDGDSSEDENYPGKCASLE